MQNIVLYSIEAECGGHGKNLKLYASWEGKREKNINMKIFMILRIEFGPFSEKVARKLRF